MVLAKQQLEHWCKALKATKLDPSGGDDAVWAMLTHLNEETPYIGTELIRESYVGHSIEDMTEGLV